MPRTQAKQGAGGNNPKGWGKLREFLTTDQAPWAWVAKAWAQISGWNYTNSLISQLTPFMSIFAKENFFELLWESSPQLVYVSAILWA